MSKEKEKSTTKFVIAEKFFGLLITVVGVLITYQTYTSLGELSKYMGAFENVFVLIGVSLIFLGGVLILAKTD